MLNKPRAKLARSALRTARSSFILLVLMLGAAGWSLGSQSSVRALWTSAGYYSNLYESSGGEKVSSLSFSASTSDWYSCNGTNCTSTPSYVQVTWNINDGSSTFEKIFGIYFAMAYCGDTATYTTVNAGPSYPSGSQYAYFSGGQCTVGYGVPWGWSAGLCDNGAGCYTPGQGPHIYWTWSPPGSSAANFGYSYTTP